MLAPRAATQLLSLHVLARGSPSNSVPRASDSSRRPRGLGRPRAAAVEAAPARSPRGGRGYCRGVPTHQRSLRHREGAGRAPPAGLYNPGQRPSAAHAHFPPKMRQDSGSCPAPRCCRRRLPTRALPPPSATEERHRVVSESRRSQPHNLPPYAAHAPRGRPRGPISDHVRVRRRSQGLWREGGGGRAR